MHRPTRAGAIVVALTVLAVIGIRVQAQKLMPPIYGEARIDVTKPATKVSGNEIITTVLVKNMAEHKGQIDLTMAQAFLGDHVDSLTGKTEPSERTLCGHIDRSPRGSGTWQPPYGIAGAVQNKATDATLAARMTFTGAVGHACGMTTVKPS